jgi:hypothetical protein
MVMISSYPRGLYETWLRGWSRRNISNKLSVEFAPGRIIRWQKRRFVVVDCTGFEAIIAREVGKRRLGGPEAVIASRNAVVVSRQIAEHFRATRLGINR